RLQLLLGTRQPADNRATGGRSEVAGANAGDGRGADRPCVVASRTIRLAGGAGAVESAPKAATPAARSGSSRSNDLGSLITVACGATISRKCSRSVTFGELTTFASKAAAHQLAPTAEG